MLVKGIRSFSPENNNVIEFYKPLTLIVGSNGAGKTVSKGTLPHYGAPPQQIAAYTVVALAFVGNTRQEFIISNIVLLVDDHRVSEAGMYRRAAS